MPTNSPEAPPFEISIHPNSLNFGKVRKGESVVEEFVIELLSGDISKLRFRLVVPAWARYDIVKDNNGGLPVTIQVSVDTEELEGDYFGNVAFSIGKETFKVPLSLSVYSVVSQPNKLVVPPPTVTPEPPEIVINIPEAPPPTVVVDNVDMSRWRRKWVPVFVAIAVVYVLFVALTDRPTLSPEKDFCSRPVLTVSGLHVVVTDNGLFMYGELSAVVLINNERYEVETIPTDITVHAFVKSVVLESVLVKTGSSKGQRSDCHIQFYP